MTGRNPADAPAVGARDAKRSIVVRGLVVPCMIGVYAHERTGTQRVRIDIRVDLDDDGRPLADDIANVVSYETVVEGVRAVAGRGHINLVETLADEILAVCLADPRSRRAWVRVEKLDVYADAAGVGIEIERARPGG